MLVLKSNYELKIREKILKEAFWALSNIAASNNIEV